jgi:hypothetical protein
MDVRVRGGGRIDARVRRVRVAREKRACPQARFRRPGEVEYLVLAVARLRVTCTVCKLPIRVGAAQSGEREQRERWDPEVRDALAAFRLYANSTFREIQRVL